MKNLLSIALAIIACGCDAVQPTKPTTKGSVVVIPDVPHVRQKPDFCGEACVEM